MALVGVGVYLGVTQAAAAAAATAAAAAPSAATASIVTTTMAAMAMHDAATVVNVRIQPDMALPRHALRRGGPQ